MNKKIDLLYPKGYMMSAECTISERNAADMQLPYIASLLCPYNTEFALELLCRLPTDIDVIRYRQDVLDDFINVPELEGVLYRSLHTIYNNAKSVYARAGSTRSFFELNENTELIESYISCMEDCHNFYEKHYSKLKSNGVKSVAEVLEEKYKSPEFKTLTQEIIELRKVLAEGIKCVTFGVNFDDLMRPTEIALLSVSKEPFRERTMFEWLFSDRRAIEPVSNIYCRKSKEGGIASINATLFKELDALSGEYSQHFNSALTAYYNTSIDFLVKLEPQINFYVGASHVYDHMKRLGLPICRPDIQTADCRLFNCQDMYDIAFASKVALNNEIKVNTNGCRMDDDGRIVILTGPNNGGKTTFTRAVGINQILAQCGLNIAASKAKISVCDQIFVHFPKEEDIGINTSRFTEECKAFSETIRKSTCSSLILMNESISTTTPTECLIIAEELMKIFADIGVRLVFTTHLHELISRIEMINNTSPNSKIIAMSAQADENGNPTYVINRGNTNITINAKYIFKRYGISYENYLQYQ